MTSEDNVDLNALAPRLQAWYRAGHRCHHGPWSLFYRAGGAGDPLLLLHGFPTASWGWHRVWDELARTWFVIAPDLLGSGFSDKPRENAYDLGQLADQCESVLAHLGVTRVDILAHAYGVGAAQELLARDYERPDERPFRLQSVAFVTGALFPEAVEVTPMQRLLTGPLGAVIADLAPQPYALFRRNLAAAFGARTRPSEREFAEFWQLLQYNAGHRATPWVMQYLHDRHRQRERLVHALQATRIPLQFIHAPDDPIIGPRTAALWRRHVPHGQTAELSSGTGHYPPLEAPRELLASHRGLRHGERAAAPREAALGDEGPGDAPAAAPSQPGRRAG